MPRMTFMRLRPSAVSTPALALRAANSTLRTTWSPLNIYNVTSPAQCRTQLLLDDMANESVESYGLLEHHHLTGPNQPIAYSDADQMQEMQRARFIAWKNLSKKKRSSGKFGVLSNEQNPRLFSFEAEPTFTLGRRQDKITAKLTAHLQRPLRVELPGLKETFEPQILNTSRGGLTTYHGPGQLVLWPVLDMHSSLHRQFGVVSYAHLLETTTQRFLHKIFGIDTFLAPDEPGVWVTTSSGRPGKIAAMGVHHQRFVTALGIAVNITVPVTGTEDVNPWARFVPCGLAGKLVTSVAAQLGTPAWDCDMKRLAVEWAELFQEGMLLKKPSTALSNATTPSA
ncbi:hypothetical protein E4U55_007778 [Claviceps digitariae]|nr:hypothetical protein E4U55_007778 [Claviceps digitariae]